MLTHLTIRNYALIEQLETDFHAGFSVITGETGAGKSIILGALALILGQRADLQSLMDENEKCIVEGIFSTHHIPLSSFFEKNNLDLDEDQTILRREILPSGKSRAFINDTPVNLNVLKELAEKLVDIHSQHKVTSLQDEEFQLDALDSFAGLDEKLMQYRQKYTRMQSLRHELGTLQSREEEAAREQDFYRFQIDELEAAKLVPGEQEQIEEELKLLVHAEEIKSRLVNAGTLFDREQGLLELIGEVMHELRPVSEYYADIAAVYKIIESSYFELKDASSAIGRLGERLETNPGQIEQLNDRLNLINRLHQKHRTSSVEALLKVKEDYRQKIAAYTSLSNRIEELHLQLSKLKKELGDMAEEISSIRKNAIPEFENEIGEIISGLGMPLAHFKIVPQTLPELSVKGADSLTYLFNANKGGEMQELSRIASGGELSRLMLAVKSLIAGKRSLSTIIFDEIDTGISGEAAGKMGIIMQKMALNMQVIAITHIPQIAARGAHHYVVFKETGEQQTKTYIKYIEQEERIVEIAKMLSDSTVTLPAMETAKELLKN